MLVENAVGASSCSRKPRPLYGQLLERAQRREFDAVLAYSNSRLTRRPPELEELIRLHESTGVRLCTVVFGDDDLSIADGRMWPGSGPAWTPPRPNGSPNARDGRSCSGPGRASR